MTARNTSDRCDMLCEPEQSAPASATSRGVVQGDESLNESEYTTCPHCGEPRDGRPHRKQKGASEECRLAYHRDRAKQFYTRHPGYYSKYDTANCYEHVCPVCGKTFRNHQSKAVCHCSVECWQAGGAERQAEKQRQRMLPILHPGPYSLLPTHHPAMQKTRRFIAGACQICGVSVITMYVRHATCGSEYCVTEKRRAERRSRKAYERSLERGGRPGVFSGSQWGARLREYNRCCAYCGGPEDIQIEHVIPVGRGGANCIANVVPACAACNGEKSWRTPQEWKASGNKRVSTLDDSGWPTGAREVAAAR